MLNWWYIKSNNEDIELSAFKLWIDNTIHEIFIDNYEFMGIKLNGLLCLNMSNRSETVINFYVKDILECFKREKKYKRNNVNNINQICNEVWNTTWNTRWKNI